MPHYPDRNQSLGGSTTLLLVFWKLERFFGETGAASKSAK
jgi:hypothetical protein